MENVSNEIEKIETLTDAVNICSQLGNLDFTGFDYAYIIIGLDKIKSCLQKESKGGQSATYFLQFMVSVAFLLKIDNDSEDDLKEKIALKWSASALIQFLVYQRRIEDAYQAPYLVAAIALVQKTINSKPTH